VAYLLQPERRDHLGLLWGVLAAAAAFVAANPPLLLAPCEFFEGFLIDNAFNTSFGDDRTDVALVRPLVQLYHVLGAALSILAGAALLYGTWLLVRREHWRSIVLIGSMFVPFLLLISNVNYASMRHVLPLAPPLLLLVGKMMADLMAARHRFAVRAGLLVGMVTMAYSGLGVLSGELQFTSDGRNLAAAWVMKHAAPGSRIEVTPYGPRLPNDRFLIEKRPFLRNLTADIADLRNASLYRVLHPIYLHYKSAAESIGLCQPRARHYLGWYEEAESRAATDLVNFDPSIDGLEARAPDLLIVSSFYYQRFLDDPRGPDGHFFKQLFEGKGSYRPIAQFHYELWPWLDPRLEFINPTVMIFQKEPPEPSTAPFTAGSAHRDYAGQRSSR
jgi:hypothetical protein